MYKPNHSERNDRSTVLVTFSKHGRIRNLL